MKGIIIKVVAAAALFIAAVAGLSALAVGLIVWRVNLGPVDAGFAKPFIEDVLSRAFAGAGDVAIDTVGLRKDDVADLIILEIGGFDLQSDYETAGSNAGSNAGFRSLQLGFDASDLLSARAGPKTVRVEDAALRIVRREDAAISLDYGPPSKTQTEQGPANVFQSLTGGPYFRNAFERADIVDAHIYFLDEATARAWTAHGATLSIVRTKMGYSARLAGDFEPGETASDAFAEDELAPNDFIQNDLVQHDVGDDAALVLTADYDVRADRISASLNVSHAPVGDILSVYLGAPESVVTGLVSGQGAVTLTGDGRVLTSFIDATALGGQLNLGGFSTAVDEMALEMNFDADNNEFLIEQFAIDTDAVKTLISGAVSARPVVSGPGYQSVSFVLNAKDIALAGGGAFENDVVIDAMDLSGAYNIIQKRGQFNDILISLHGAKGRGRLSFATFAEDSPEIKGELAFDAPLTKEEVLSVWPVQAAFAARTFVRERVAAANFQDVKARLDLEAGAVNDGAIMPEEAMALSFRAIDAEVAYAPTMTPIKDLAGNGVLAGNSFTLDAEQGRVGDVLLMKGRVSIPKLRPKGHPATFTFDAAGDAADVLAILDEPPLHVLKETAFKADDFRGKGTLSAKIIRPNQRDAPRDAYRYEATASFAGLTVYDFYQDTPLTDASAEISLKTGEMTVEGAATLSGSPTEFVWNQRFSGQKSDRTQISIEGRLDSRFGDLFGLPMRQFVRGTPPFSATARGDLSAIREARLQADFTDVLLVSEALSWRKPKGARARGALALTFGEESLETLSVDIEGDGLAVDGLVQLSAAGALKGVDFERLYLDGLIDVAIAAERNQDGLTMNIEGPRLVLAGAVDQVSARSGGGDVEAGGPRLADLLAETRGVVAIDEVVLKSGVLLNDAALTFDHGPERLSAFSFTAAPNGAGVLAASLETAEGDDPEQRIIAQTDDLGALFAGLFGVRSVESGEGRISFAMDAPLPDHVDPMSLNAGPEEMGMEAVAPASGEISAKNFRVVGAPLLARVFSAGSLTGLSDLLSGDGIEIQDMSARFSVEDGQIALYDGRATGPSVGLTAQGDFSLGADGRLALSGAVAPAYQLNSFLGSAPLIGELFVNREGEGIVAVSYAVTGAPQNPVIAVNPLSALAPGVFRRIFEPSTPVLDADSGAVDDAPDGETNSDTP
ncbi:MAG: DUF3971 domain-containing protein [Pseudomonadota bacterium]